jgi:hypothetical protein
MRVVSAVIVLAGIAAGQTIKTEASGPIDSSVCDLLRTPDKFHFRAIRVRGFIHPTGVDSPNTLSDPACSSGTGSIILRFGETNERYRDEAWDRMHQLLMHGFVVNATINGRFEMVLGPSPGESSAVFIVLRVVDILGSMNLASPQTKKSK